MASGIMIAATGSGSGKTMITCALLETLKNRGREVCAFKCGPDYIDPMFHRRIIGVPARNLDSFFSDGESLRKIVAENVKEDTIAVVEGAMGLFDGLGGIREEGSAYQIACMLQLPILLIVNAHGMGRSILPLLDGFLHYDREKRIAGVILNQTSENFYKKIAPVIEEELGIPVLGFMPKKKELVWGSRHLGLVLPEEIKGLKEQVHFASNLLEESVPLDRIVEIARRKGKIFVPVHGKTKSVGKRVRIGVARDEAFCFYYEENLKLLEEKGADLVPFSPLYDKELPEDLDGLLLGGGYPELYAKRLEENDSMRASIRQKIESGLPSLAECGGFMYLHKTLKDDKGNQYEMCGVLPKSCFYKGRLVRFGYLALEEKRAAFLKNGTVIKGHEFHYYESEDNGRDCIARKPVSGQSFDCIHCKTNQFWGFPHLYYPSSPDFAAHFIQEARAFQKKA